MHSGSMLVANCLESYSRAIFLNFWLRRADALASKNLNWGHGDFLCSKPESYPAECGQNTFKVFALAMLKPKAAQTQIILADEFGEHAIV